MTSRRQFLGTALGTLAVAAACRPGAIGATSARKRILILGGTGFVGPHQVRHALAQGHQVSIFNRGRSGTPGMFGANVEELVGDRANNLEALKGRRWDVAIDESASQGPTAADWVRASATLLKDNVDHYIFISTRSVYFDTSRVPMTADAPVLSRENTPMREGQAMGYGMGKAYAEKTAHEIMPGRVTVVRPGLIIGPEDDTDRFTYWPVRIARGGEVLVPGDGSDHVQNIDVRDLVEFTIKLAEDGTFGVFNAVGPDRGQTFRQFAEGIKRGVGGNATFTWVGTDFLIANNAQPYGRELPCFQPMRGRTAGFAQFDLTPEIRAGLKFRSTEVTARETIEWWRTLPAERQGAMRTGFAAERDLLAKWKAR